MSPSNLVLIVEDDKYWRDELVRILSDSGYRCIAACNYESGLDKLRNHHPFTLVLDLQLRNPHTEDEEFVGWKLAQEALEYDVPIIIITGHPSVARARKAFRVYKVIDFFDKADFNKGELIRRVSEGEKVSREKSLSSSAKQRAISELRRMFYGGEGIRSN